MSICLFAEKACNISSGKIWTNFIHPDAHSPEACMPARLGQTDASSLSPEPSNKKMRSNCVRHLDHGPGESSSFLARIDVLCEKTSPSQTHSHSRRIHILYTARRRTTSYHSSRAKSWSCRPPQTSCNCTPNRTKKRNGLRHREETTSQRHVA